MRCGDLEVKHVIVEAAWRHEVAYAVAAFIPYEVVRMFLCRHMFQTCETTPHPNSLKRGIGRYREMTAGGVQPEKAGKDCRGRGSL